jgi:hypothetical protein
MDVAYRLAPETDLMGMVHDVKRAIAWMKKNAGVYGINPDRIVVGGGSAGGHLALMTAYTANDLQFTPKELEGKDNSIRAVISFYGPCNMEVTYYHTNQYLTTRPTPGSPQKTGPTQMPGWIIKKMGKEYHRLGMDKGSKLQDGTYVVIHCRMGIGRSSIIAASVLLRVGVKADNIIDNISKIRGLKVPDTDRQLQWLKARQ